MLLNSNQNESNTLFNHDFIEVNEIDNLIINGMVSSEKVIQYYKLNHPWSPTLVRDNVEVQF